VDARRSGDDENAPREPWHVPDLSADALALDLPPEVEDAAKRAFDARRPATRLAELVTGGLVDDLDAWVYSFADGDVAVALRVRRQAEGLRLHISCAGRRRGLVEVLHGGETLHARLDGTGCTEVEVATGLLSVIIRPEGQDAPPVQTTWIRVR
jgi:hypothetical protein